MNWLKSLRLAALALGSLVLGPSHAELPTYALVPAGAPARFEPAYFGIHVHNDGDQRRWPDIPVGSLRLWDADVSWTYLEPKPGVFDFDRLDEYVAWATARRMEILLPLGVTPTWASARPQEVGAYGKGTAAEPARMEDWRAYVRTVAKRYRGRIAYYQVWNEVTEHIFYSGSLDQLVQLTVAAREEIRKVDPAARMVAPSAVGLDWRLTWPARFLAAGGAGSVDAVAFHLYHGGEPPEHIVEPLLKLQAIQAAAGHAALPLWNTESGYWVDNPAVRWDEDARRNIVPEAKVAIYLPRDLILARALGFSRFHWYAWDNRWLGLRDPARGTHRPAADVYGQVIRQLSGSTLERCDRAPNGLWTCRLRAPDGAALQALWMDPQAPKPQLSLAAPLPGRWLALDGRSTWQPPLPQLNIGAVVTLVSDRP